MSITTDSLIKQTNEIVDGIIKHASKKYDYNAAGIHREESHQLLLETIKAASVIMHGKMIAISNKQ